MRIEELAKGLQRHRACLSIGREYVLQPTFVQALAECNTVELLAVSRLLGEIENKSLCDRIISLPLNTLWWRAQHSKKGGGK